MADVPVIPRPAATVALVRPGPDGLEVLLTRRPTTMAFAADLHVFPGGRVDPADADPRLVARSTLDPVSASAALGGIDGSAALASHAAAVRELLEEAGVLLAEPDPPPDALAAARDDLLAGRRTLADVADAMALRLRTDRLVPLAHWTTPPFMDRRFATQFFAAPLPPASEPSFAVEEVVDHRWLRPIDALEAMAEGRLGMWLPTSTTLQRLAAATTLDELRVTLRHGPVGPPVVEDVTTGIRRVVSFGAGAVPGRRGETLLVGRREVLVVDPGDPSEPALDAIRDAIRQANGEIVGIALTGPDPDRAAGAESLAISLAVPVFGPPGTGRHLPYDVVEIAPGATAPAGDVPWPSPFSGAATPGGSAAG